MISNTALWGCQKSMPRMGVMCFLSITCVVTVWTLLPSANLISAAVWPHSPWSGLPSAVTKSPQGASMPYSWIAVPRSVSLKMVTPLPVSAMHTMETHLLPCLTSTRIRTEWNFRAAATAFCCLSFWQFSCHLRMLHVCSTAPAFFRMLRLSRRRLACADANACRTLLMALLLSTIRASILDAVA